MVGNKPVKRGGITSTTNRAKNISDSKDPLPRNSKDKDADDLSAAPKKAPPAHQKLMSMKIPIDPPGQAPPQPRTGIKTRSTAVAVAKATTPPHQVPNPFGSSPLTSFASDQNEASLSANTAGIDKSGSPKANMELDLHDNSAVNLLEPENEDRVGVNQAGEHGNGEGGERIKRNERSEDGGNEGNEDSEDSDIGRAPTHLPKALKLHHKDKPFLLHLAQHANRSIVEDFTGTVDIYRRDADFIAKTGNVMTSVANEHSPLKNRTGHLWRDLVRPGKEKTTTSVPLGRVQEYAAGTASFLKSDAFMELPVTECLLAGGHTVYEGYLYTDSVAEGTKAITNPAIDENMGVNEPSTNVVPPADLAAPAPVVPAVNIDDWPDMTELRAKYNKSRTSKELKDYVAKEVDAPREEWDRAGTLLEAWNREQIIRKIRKRVEAKFKKGLAHKIPNGEFAGVKFTEELIQDICLMTHTAYAESKRNFLEAETHPKLKKFFKDPETYKMSGGAPITFFKKSQLLTGKTGKTGKGEVTGTGTGSGKSGGKGKDKAKKKERENEKYVNLQHEHEKQAHLKQLGLKRKHESNPAMDNKKKHKKTRVVDDAPVISIHDSSDLDKEEGGSNLVNRIYVKDSSSDDETSSSSTSSSE